MNNNQSVCTCGMTHDDSDYISKVEFVINGQVQIAINLIGVIANSTAVCVILRSKLLQNSFYKTLVFLALFDGIFNICDIFESLLRHHYVHESCLPMPILQRIHYYLWPQFLYPLRYIAMLSSIFATVGIAAQRYIAVSRPFGAYQNDLNSTWQHAIKLMIPVIAISTACYLPKFCEYKIRTKHMMCSRGGQIAHYNISTFQSANDSCWAMSNEEEVHNSSDSRVADDISICGNISHPYFKQQDIWKDPLYKILYINVFLHTVTFVIPLISLFFLNRLTYLALKERRRALPNLGKYIGNM